MNDKIFVGIGKNPDPNGLDMPIGLGMALYQNSTALHCFAAISQEERNGIIAYIESAKDGNDTKSRIDNTVKNLNKRNLNFF